MDGKKRSVGLYGNNLVISAIGTSLQQMPQFQVHWLEQQLPATGETAGVTHPDVILFDLSSAPADLALSWLQKYPMLTLIGVDIKNNKMLVLSGGDSRLLTAEDLIRAIERGCSRE